MKKPLALVLTPVVILAILVIAIVVAVGLSAFFAMNPFLLLGILGIPALIVFVTSLFAAFMFVVMIVAGVYYFLRGTGEPFQRAPADDYSISDEKEVGRKEQTTSKKS